MLTLLLPSIMLSQTPCQTCCSPGGSCDTAKNGKPGFCCGQINGEGPGYCCGEAQKCVACVREYRCYTGLRPPPDTCANSGGFTVRMSSRGGGGMNADEEVVSTVIGLVAVVCLFYALFQCLRRQAPQPLAAQQGIAMQPACEIPMGRPIPAGQAGAMPVAAATAYPMQAGYPAAGCYPVHAGYSGGTVAMGAGMGFLGGMMMGEAMAGAHHGGDYGYGGGDWGGGGGDFGSSCAADM